MSGFLSPFAPFAPLLFDNLSISLAIKYRRLWLFLRDITLRRLREDWKMRSIFVASFVCFLGAGSAMAQLEYVADWAPSPLPEIDIDAYPQVHYIHDFDGEPLYPADYPNLAYIDVNAPSGGTLRQAAVGTFDSFNPVLSRGQLGAGLSLTGTRLIDSNADDLDSAYVIGAEYLQMPEDRSWIVYKIRDEMTWPNGESVTPQDYIWSMLQSLEHSAGFARAFEGRLMAVEDIGDNRVLIRFNPESLSRNDPIQMGITTIMPRYHFEAEDAERTLGETFLEPFPGVGPYEITDFKAGQYIEYSLKEDWWGFDIPPLKGSYEDKIIYTYYGDRVAVREAVKAGDVDLFSENSSKSWEFDWDNVAAIDNGDLRKEAIEAGGLKSPQMFILNLRNPLFQDRRVREALNYTFDFETTNETTFFGQYSRTESFFQNSDLQATGTPSDAELEILQDLYDRYGEEYVPSAVFGPAFQNPTTAGDGNNRENLSKALDLLAEAGWTLNDDGQLVDADGEQMAFTYIYGQPVVARYADPWIENLRRIGIDATGRLMDPNVWWDAYRNRDFDVTSTVVQSTYLGYLVYYTWGSLMKDNPQSRAAAGLDNPAVDEIAEQLLNASTREQVNLLANVVDRLLTHNHVGIFQWYVPTSRLVWWDKFNEGLYRPEYGSATTGWYIDPTKEENLIGRSGYSLD